MEATTTKKTYYQELGPIAQKNMAILLERMKKRGITNPFAQAAILSIVSKESGFMPKSENLNYTSAEQLHKIFSHAFPTVESAKPYIKNPIAIANKVYGGKGGNNAPGDGFKYRGRGYNQITFKDEYKEYGDKIGVDLVNNPDSLNIPTVAADALIEFFKDSFNEAPKAKLAVYNTTGINDFKTLPDSVGAFYHANAGWGHSVDQIKADPTGGRKLAIERSPGLLELVSNHKVAAGGTVFFFLAVAVVVWKRKPLMELANKILNKNHEKEKIH